MLNSRYQDLKLVEFFYRYRKQRFITIINSNPEANLKYFSTIRINHISQENTSLTFCISVNFIIAKNVPYYLLKLDRI